MLHHILRGRFLSSRMLSTGHLVRLRYHMVGHVTFMVVFCPLTVTFVSAKQATHWMEMHTNYIQWWRKVQWNSTFIRKISNTVAQSHTGTCFITFSIVTHFLPPQQYHGNKLMIFPGVHVALYYMYKQVNTCQLCYTLYESFRLPCAMRALAVRVTILSDNTQSVLWCICMYMHS